MLYIQIIAKVSADIHRPNRTLTPKMNQQEIKFHDNLGSIINLNATPSPLIPKMCKGVWIKTKHMHHLRTFHIF